MPIRPSGRQRRSEMEPTERAVIEDPDDVADATVVEVELARRGIPLDRH
jgi:hypothetical protein